MCRQQMLATAIRYSTLLQVILTVRDEDKWHQSVKDVIVRLYQYLLRPFFWHTHLGRQYTAIIGWNLTYMFNGRALKPIHGGSVPLHTGSQQVSLAALSLPRGTTLSSSVVPGDMSKENCIDAFRKHTAEVKAMVPTEQLLIWKPQDGWKPLTEWVLLHSHAVVACAIAHRAHS